MSVIKPFRAFRPRPELASQVATLPYDVMNSDEARAMVKGNPYSFLHVDKAEVDLHPGIHLYDERVYQKARENLDWLINKRIMLQEEESCFYIYRQVMQDREQTGIVACVSADDYLNGVIKKHELTRADKENDRTKHVAYCDAHTGPIFLSYRAVSRVNDLVEVWTQDREPVYDILSDDGISHIIWVVDDPEVIVELQRLFADIPNLYIADGHHRSASAVNVCQMRRKQQPDYTGEEEYNFFLSVLFPDEDLYIMDYNRLVVDLNGLSREEFLTRLQSFFEIVHKGTVKPYKPTRKHTFGMYLEACWYELTAREDSFDHQDPVASLDVSILQNQVLEPILGIGDVRTDGRIDFVGGIRGLNELEKRVGSGEMKVAFSMFPTGMDDLMAIADAGKIMPPKSTWFEPKLRSGLFVHKLD
ncbi:MAG: DUF1015 family protein [Bacillota bacterium]|nr:DUF1015 family protein [Bacillota bacterium]